MNQDRNTADRDYHRPVLADEVVGLLAPVLPGVVVDATFGGGGHARRLLDEFGDDVKLIAIDRDPEALANARGLRVSSVAGNFGALSELVGSVTTEPISAVLFDFGVSSHQLDEPARGFSYRNDGPLDMRMGPDATLTADEMVNQWPEDRLARGDPEAGRRAAGPSHRRCHRRRPSDRVDRPACGCDRRSHARGTPSRRSSGPPHLSGDPDDGQRRVGVDRRRDRPGDPDRETSKAGSWPSHIIRWRTGSSSTGSSPAPPGAPAHRTCPCAVVARAPSFASSPVARSGRRPKRSNPTTGPAPRCSRAAEKVAA